MKKKLPIASLFLFLLASSACANAAIAIAQAPDLAELSLEQLTRITVTSASRREEKVIEAPASIFVITAEDIRRSGATTIPEILRLAPNLQVARADNNQYAVSARGFLNVLSNKMLVLVDGRTVYSPLFSGVFWEAQDLFIEDIERIEVIDGPATTLWGSNGVNGVISIRTYSAKRTPGTLAYAGGGTRESGVGARIGAKLGEDTSYRVYAKYWDRDNFDLASGPAIRDGSKGTTGGFRADWERPTEAVTLQGDAYWSDIDQAPSARKISGGNLLGRWNKELAPDSMLRVQAYYDRTHRDQPGTIKEDLDTFDLDVQQSMRAWSTHEVVLGGGYRYARDRVTNSPANAFLPADRNLRWSNLFAQDEFEVAKGLHVTLGLKLETNVYTPGAEWLPNVRLAYQPNSQHLLWAAWSRALRAPSRVDRDFYLPGVAPYFLAGNDRFESEIARVTELGYRAQMSEALSFSFTGFHDAYPNLRGVDTNGQGSVAFTNSVEGLVYGIEGWGSWRVVPAWRLTGGFVAMHERFNVIPGMRDIGGIAALGTDPRFTAQLRSAWDITPRHELDLALRHVGELGKNVTPAYTVLDARLGWRPIREIELSLTVQNVFDRGYSEWGAAPTSRALLERALFFKIVWKTG
jgi:iron complex outermembrane recepter protein